MASISSNVADALYNLNMFSGQLLCNTVINVLISRSNVSGLITSSNLSITKCPQSPPRCIFVPPFLRPRQGAADLRWSSIINELIPGASSWPLITSS